MVGVGWVMGELDVEAHFLAVRGHGWIGRIVIPINKLSLDSVVPYSAFSDHRQRLPSTSGAPFRNHLGTSRGRLDSTPREGSLFQSPS